MNTHDDELSRMLGSSLHRQAQGVTGGPDLGEVLTRARRIRRRRRQAVTGLAVVAVAAIAVPTTLLLGPGSGSQVNGPAHSGPTGSTPTTSTHHTTAPSPTTTPTPTGGAHAATTFALDPATLARGAAAQATWVDAEHVLHEYGTATPLPDGFTSAVTAQGSIMATDGTHLDAISSTTHKITSRALGSGPFVVSQDGTQVGWWTEGAAGQPGVLHGGGASTMGGGIGGASTPAGEHVDPIAFVARGMAYEVTLPSGATQVWTTDFQGHDTRVAGAIEATSGLEVPNELLIETSQKTDGGSCWALRSLTTGHDAWTTCSYSLDALDPDGKYVLATTAQRGGPFLSGFAVLDARTGAPVAQFDAKNASLDQVLWDYDGGILVSMHGDDGRWYLVRTTVKNDATIAEGPVAASEVAEPWSFVIRP